jgi:hypothetical protein
MRRRKRYRRRRETEEKRKKTPKEMSEVRRNLRLFLSFRSTRILGTLSSPLLVRKTLTAKIETHVRNTLERGREKRALILFLRNTYKCTTKAFCDRGGGVGPK